MCQIARVGPTKIATAHLAKHCVFGIEQDKAKTESESGSVLLCLVFNEQDKAKSESESGSMPLVLVFSKQDKAKS